jgi:hypothetical protein
VPIAADTSPDADVVQLDAYRRLGGTGRVQVMFHLNDLVRRTVEAGIRKRHPQYDDGEVLRALARLLYGDDLVRAAWAGRELVDP